MPPAPVTADPAFQKLPGTRLLGTRLSGIEALRGVAAAAVVLSHSARHVDKAFGAPGLITAFQAGHAGVDLFFTISGFIILFVHRPDIGQPNRLRHYLGRRFTRVMPLYWAALGLTLGMSMAAGHALPAALRLLWSAALLPSLQEPLLGIAWTLQFEVVFYAAFAILILQRTVGLALMAAWLACIVLALSGGVVAGVPPQLHDIYGLEFFMGMAAAQWLHRGTAPSPRLVAGIGALLFVAMLVLESAGILDGYGVAARFAYGVPAAVLIVGVGSAEQAGRLAVPGWLRTLGGASYSIYLFQFVFIGLVWQGWLAAKLDRHVPNLVLFAALAGTALIGGIVMARLVERPLLRLMRGKPGRTKPGRSEPGRSEPGRSEPGRSEPGRGGSAITTAPHPPPRSAAAPPPL